MLTALYTPHDGIVLSLTNLRRILERLSRDQGRWWLEEPLVLRRSSTWVNAAKMILVFHSRSGPDQATDELSFLVPVVWIGAALEEERTLVWLDPELIEPRMEGLYVEGGRIMSDFIADWERFWVPLKAGASRCLTNLPEGRS